MTPLHSLRSSGQSASRHASSHDGKALMECETPPLTETAQHAVVPLCSQSSKVSQTDWPMDEHMTVPHTPCPGRDSGRRANGRTRGDLLPCEHTGCTALHTTPRMPLRTAPSARFRPQAQGRTSEALAQERLHPATFPLSGQHASYLPFMACQHDSYLVHSICRSVERVNSQLSPLKWASQIT